MNNHLVNFARVFPQQTIAFRELKGVWGSIKRGREQGFRYKAEDKGEDFHNLIHR
jgi:hypothetical protein